MCAAAAVARYTAAPAAALLAAFLAIKFSPKLVVLKASLHQPCAFVQAHA
jgi:hypothetical protein